MAIYVSVVSHLDHDVIINLETIKNLRQYPNVKIVCRDNRPVKKLQNYCEKYGLIYLPNTREQGFAKNNNQNFLYCQNQLGMKEDDLFILLNPDIFFCTPEIDKLISRIETAPPQLATCDLYLDREYMVQDDNIRIFPKFINFIKTYLLNDRSTMVNRHKNFQVTDEHWFSCSFMMVKAGVYTQLKGLDERYYLYCEDIDISYRAKKMGVELTYLNDIKAIHYRRRESKRFLSQYFFWHVASVFKYSFCKKKAEAKKSCLKTKK